MIDGNMKFSDFMELKAKTEYENALRLITINNKASSLCAKLYLMLNEYSSQIGEDYIVCLGSTNTYFEIAEISYNEPNFIIFKGFDQNNQPMNLIQHISQISLLLSSKKRINTEQPKRIIGFKHQDCIQDLTP